MFNPDAAAAGNRANRRRGTGQERQERPGLERPGQERQERWRGARQTERRQAGGWTRGWGTERVRDGPARQQPRWPVTRRDAAR